MTKKQTNNIIVWIVIIFLLLIALVHKTGYNNGYEARRREKDHWECEYKWENENMDEMSVKCLRKMGVGSNLPDTK